MSTRVMTTNIERAGLVARDVQIESVTLVHTRMTTTLDDASRPTELRLGNSFRCRYQLRSSDPDRLRVHVEFQFEANPSEGEHLEAAVVEIMATFLATYTLPDAQTYPADALRHFADLNGTYNAWPYWRELVQSMTGRAGMPGVTVPVFTPKVREVAVQEDLPALEGGDSGVPGSATSLASAETQAS